jgi:hypothetical protein
VYPDLKHWRMLPKKPFRWKASLTQQYLQKQMQKQKYFVQNFRETVPVVDFRLFSLK